MNIALGITIMKEEIIHYYSKLRTWKINFVYERQNDWHHTDVTRTDRKDKIVPKTVNGHHWFYDLQKHTTCFSMSSYYLLEEKEWK